MTIATHDTFELTRRDVREITEPVRWIINAWLRSGAAARPFPAQPAARYYNDHRELLLRLLGKHSATIAHVPGEAELYMGFVCGGVPPAPLHYIYVKEAWRKLGLATALLKDRGPERTHRSDKVWTEQWLERRLAIKWAPYRLTELGR